MKLLRVNPLDKPTGRKGVLNRELEAFERIRTSTVVIEAVAEKTGPDIAGRQVVCWLELKRQSGPSAGFVDQLPFPDANVVNRDSSTMNNELEQLFGWCI
jgi:hypothetical protein